MNPFAFIAQGRLYVQAASGAVREVKSHFGDKIRSREAEIQQRNAWKTQGSGARFMGLARMRSAEVDPALMPIHVTSVAVSGTPDDLLYTLETPAICGLLRSERLGDDEQRLWHSNERRIGDLCRHPSEPQVCCSIQNGDGTSSIGIMNADGTNLERLTEGESVDQAPRWSMSAQNRIIYQSAGVARNQDGVFCGLGPFCIHELDRDGSALDTVLESPQHDLLVPQIDGNGVLYFIRRPYEAGLHRPWWKTALDVLLLPLRLLQAIFGFLNFFSTIFTGKPLITQAGGPRQNLDATRMILWGNFVDAQKAIRQARGAETPDLVPKSWQLVRREPSGAETILATGVISYDLCKDGSILYSNGSGVFLRTPAGEVETLAKHSYIQQVIALPAE